LAVVATAVAVVGLLAASVSFANNLDNRTMVNAAKQVAKQDCRNTSGCRDYFVRGMHRVSRHKGVGKIIVISVKNGTVFACRRQIVIKLDHFSGEINYAVSQRKCDEVGPA
jgi:hypothetical protein